MVKSVMVRLHKELPELLGPDAAHLVLQVRGGGGGLAAMGHEWQTPTTHIKA